MSESLKRPGLSWRYVSNIHEGKKSLFLILIVKERITFDGEYQRYGVYEVLSFEMVRVFSVEGWMSLGAAT